MEGRNPPTKIKMSSQHQQRWTIYTQNKTLPLVPSLIYNHKCFLVIPLSGNVQSQFCPLPLPDTVLILTNDELFGLIFFSILLRWESGWVGVQQLAEVNSSHHHGISRGYEQVSVLVPAARGPLCLL